MRFACLLWLVNLGNCFSDDAVYWAPYNSAGDAVEISVGPEVGEDKTIELFSSTGAVSVGTATISPGSGPVGTVHAVEVTVDEEFAADVGRVTIDADSSRGLTAHELTSDSALAGLWVSSVTSLGDDDEVREDTFTVVLWQLSDKDDPEAVQAP